MARLIQVANLPDSIDSLDLQALFQVHGAVRSALIARDIETGRSTGVGFIEMASEEEGAAAIAALNHLEHYGHELSVCWNAVFSKRLADRQKMFGPMNIINEDTMGEDFDRQ
jgi:RNA recognition motif-containing protein